MEKKKITAIRSINEGDILLDKDNDFLLIEKVKGKVKDYGFEIRARVSKDPNSFSEEHKHRFDRDELKQYIEQGLYKVTKTDYSKYIATITTLVAVLLLSMLIGGNAVVGTYSYLGVQFEFDSQLKQCDNIKEKLFRDSETDFINLERTNEDRMVSSEISGKIQNCEKIMLAPDHYVKGRFLSWWFWAIFANILLLAVITLLTTGSCVIATRLYASIAFRENI